MRPALSPPSRRLVVGFIVVVALSGATLSGQAGPPNAPVAQWPQFGSEQEWSFGSAAFVYTSQASGIADLWLKRGPGGEVTNLTNGPAQDHWASWFPDGERIAFESLRDGNREIYVMSAGGADLVNLTQNPAQDLLPAVSPDGQRILFFSDRGIEHGPSELPGNLWVMDADGGNVERLTDQPLGSTFPGAWSPDGYTVVLARDFDGDVDLVLLDVETHQEQRILGTDAAESSGQFSPDGRRIAFNAAGDGDESRIVVVDLGSGERSEVTRGAQHYQPSWSPDGRWLMITGAPSGATQFDLLMVSVNGGRVLPLVATEADERSGSWRPAG